jgi:hypothetical protein
MRAASLNSPALYGCTEEAAAWVTAIKTALAAARQAAVDGVNSTNTNSNTADNNCAVGKLYKHKLVSDRPVSSSSSTTKRSTTAASSSTQQQQKQKDFEIKLIPQSARWGEPIDVGTVKDGESLVCELSSGGTVEITRGDLEASATQIAVVYPKAVAAALPTHVQLTSAYSTPLQHRRVTSDTATASTGSSATIAATKATNNSSSTTTANANGSAYIAVSVAVGAAACAVALVTEQMTVPAVLSSVVSAATAAVLLAAVCAVSLIKALKHSCAVKKQASIVAKAKAAAAAAAAVKTAANSPKRTANGTVSSVNGRPGLGGRRISNSLSQYSEWVITLQTCNNSATAALSGKQQQVAFTVLAECTE